jgi:low affinity Fe/Cu permease
MIGWFDRVAKWSAVQAGKSSTFIVTVALILIWAMLGPVFRFSDTWQLVVNTATTLATTLLVLLVQHTQNVHDTALHLKIDELIRAIDNARNEFISIENKASEEIAELADQGSVR